MLGHIFLLADSPATVSTVIDALKSGMSDVSSQALAAIGGVIPSAIPIMAGMTVLSLGYKVFKKFGK